MHQVVCKWHQTKMQFIYGPFHVIHQYPFTEECTVESFQKLDRSIIIKKMSLSILLMVQRYSFSLYKSYRSEIITLTDSSQTIK